MMTRGELLRAAILAASGLGGAGCASVDVLPPTPERNRQTALSFVNTVFNEKRVQEGFDAYVGSTYTQHNPIVPDGREGSIAGLTWLMNEYPQYEFIVHRSLADGDFVMIHAETHHVRGDRGDAVVDIFRFENGRIVEHWDVIQPVPETTRNANGMF